MSVEKLGNRFKPGQNPRKTFRKHKERGPISYSYTAASAASALDMSPSQLRRLLGRRISSLQEVVRLAVERSQGDRLTHTWAQVAQFLDLPESDVRELGRPKLQYLYEELQPGENRRKRKRTGQKEIRPAHFDPHDLLSIDRWRELHRRVEERMQPMLSALCDLVDQGAPNF